MDGTGITRRALLVTGTLAAAGVACGITTGCTIQPEGGVSETPTPTTVFEGGGEMGKRVLVGYATRTGSTEEIARTIGEEIAARGFSVDVKPLRERPSLDGYDAVVLGSAVNGGTWLPEAETYVKANAAKLESRGASAFCVHIMNTGDDEHSRVKRTAYLDTVRKSISTSAEGFFAGVGPSAGETSLVARWALKAFGGREGDCRDWDAIRAWARSVPLAEGTGA